MSEISIDTDGAKDFVEGGFARNAILVTIMLNLQIGSDLFAVSIATAWAVAAYVSLGPTFKATGSRLLGRSNAGHSEGDV